MARLDAASSGSLAVYARILGDSEPLVAYRADDDFPSASIIKLVIMASLVRLQEASQPDLLSERLTLRVSQQVDGSPMLEHAQPGQSFPVARLLHAMIAQSDNTASNMLIDLLGFTAINYTAQSLELTRTQLRRHFLDSSAIVRHIQNRTSARDMGRLLLLIEHGARGSWTNVASAQGCKMMVSLMLQQEDRETIPEALPPGTQIANKTGELSHVRNDVAIVTPYGSRPYVIACLTKDLDVPQSGFDVIRSAARAIYHVVYA